MKLFFASLLPACLLFSSCCDCKETSNIEVPVMSLGEPHGVKSDRSITLNDIKNNTSTVHYGIDVSVYQGDLMEMLNARKDSLTFVICKATQGVRYTDPDFRSNWHDVKAKGLIRGAYHFYMCSEDPVEQATHFCGEISDIEETDIGPVLDIEQAGLSANTDPEKMKSDLLIFLKKVKELTNRTAIITTNYGFAQQYLSDPEFGEYGLWIADYTKAAEPIIPEAWKGKGFKIWQRSDSYSVDSKTSDLDLHVGPLHELVQ